MKTFTQVMASIQIPLLIAAPLLAPAAALASDCAPCNEYFSQKSVVETYCAQNPSPPPGKVGSGRDGTSHETLRGEKPLTCNEMKEKFRAEFGILGEQCEAASAAKEGSKKEKTTAVVYTAAAAACWAGCYYAPMESICKITGGLATVTDLFQAFQLGSLANGLTGVLSGAGQLGAQFTEVGQKFAFDAAGKMNGNAAGPKAGKANTACVSAVLHTVIAGLKWAGATGAQKSAGNACTVAGNLRGSGSGTIAGGSYMGTTGRGGTNGGAGSTPVAEAPMTSDSLMNEMRSAATADPYGAILSNMPNADKIPEVLDKVGLTPDAISKGLDSQSPGSMLSGMPGMPKDVAEALKNLDKEMAADPNFQTIVAHSGGGSGKAGGGKDGPGFPDLSGLFGKKEESGASLGATVDFKSTRKDDGDIWHASWKGSIFQIVSGRLDKSRDKIDQLEWQSPLNRALTGLPSKPKEKK